MTAPIVRQLIRKDLYLVRWIVLSAIVSGLVAIGLMPLGTVTAYVGFVSLICVIVILNIFLVMTAVVQERKDKVQLFILSLPVSTRQYAAAKMASNAIAFVVPWCILTAAVRGDRCDGAAERHPAVSADRARVPPDVLLRAPARSR